MDNTSANEALQELAVSATLNKSHEDLTPLKQIEVEPILIKEPMSKESLENLRYQIKKLSGLVFTLSFASGVTMYLLYPKLFHIKDVLHAQAYEYTYFKSIVSIPWILKPLVGYIEDSTSVGGYRIKFWLCLASILYVISCAAIFFAKPTLWSFTVYDFFCSSANVMQDVIAQGLSVVVMNMKRTLREAESTASNQPAEMQGNVFGNYVLIRFLIKAFGSFAGGIFAGKYPIGNFYIIIGAFQVFIFFFVIFFVDEVQRKSAYEREPTFWENMVAFWEVISQKDLIQPIIMMVIILCMPNITDAGVFLLTNKLGWTGLELSLNWLIAAILYFITMMYVINVLTKLNFRAMYISSCLALVVFALLYFRFIYYDEISYGWMFSLTLAANFLFPLADELTMILVVGRMSSRCPPGIESFATTTIAALTNFSGALSGILGARILEVSGVKDDDYSNLYVPAMIVVGYTTTTVFISPLLAK